MPRSPGGETTETGASLDVEVDTRTAYEAAGIGPMLAGLAVLAAAGLRFARTAPAPGSRVQGLV